MRVPADYYIILYYTISMSNHTTTTRTMNGVRQEDGKIETRDDVRHKVMKGLRGEAGSRRLFFFWGMFNRY
jgi:hypothetical protein